MGAPGTTEAGVGVVATAIHMKVVVVEVAATFLMDDYEWISIQPPTFRCGEYSGDVERAAAVSAAYKAALVLKNGGYAPNVLAEDRDNQGKEWLVWFVDDSGLAWRVGIYEKLFRYEDSLTFSEKVAPEC